VYVSDDIGLDPQEDIGGITGSADGQWKVVSDTRHGIQGLWRGRFDPNELDGEFDSHFITPIRESFDAFLTQGGVSGKATFDQVMTLDGTNIEVARH